MTSLPPDHQPQSDALIVEKLGDEAIVFDPRTDEVHHLNADAVQAFARATDDVSRRNLLRGGLIVGGAAAVTSMLAPTAASALCLPGQAGPLATPFDLATELGAFITANTASGAANTTDFTYNFFTSAAGVPSTTTPTALAYVVIGAPTNILATNNTGSSPHNRPPGTSASYKITAVDANGNESVASLATSDLTFDVTGVTQTNSIGVTWTAVASAASYRIYRRTSGAGNYNFVGTSATNNYSSTSSDSVTTTQPPAAAPGGTFSTASATQVAIGTPKTATTVTLTTTPTRTTAVGFKIPATGYGVGSGLTLAVSATATFASGTVKIVFADNTGTIAVTNQLSLTSGVLGTTSHLFTPVTAGATYYALVESTALTVTLTIDVKAS